MIDALIENKEQIWKCFIETNEMVYISLILCVIVSIPLGTLLYAFRKDFLLKSKWGHNILSFILNGIRSTPFLLLMFVLVPVNRFFFDTAYGVISSIIPLTLVSASIYTRFVEQAYMNVDQEIIDRAISMGSTKFQIIFYFLLPSTFENLVLYLTSMIIALLGYSTVMGVIGAGGLGDYAFRYGYLEYEHDLMYVIILIFIFYVFIIQNIGYAIANRISSYKENE